MIIKISNTSKNYNNFIKFEHTFFASKDYVDYFLEHFGYEVLEHEYFREDHSIFFCAKKINEVKEVNIPKEIYQKNKDLFENYVSYHKELVSNLNNLEGTIYLFGAHIFSQTLLQFGLDSKKVVCILDNDPNKQGKRLYGTDLLVKSPEILRGIKHGTVLLKTGVYNKEIKKQINEINLNIKFI